MTEGNETIEYSIVSATSGSNVSITSECNPGGTTSTHTIIDVPPVIAAADDSENGAAGDTDVLNVFTGDTVSGAAATVSNAVVSLAPGETVPAELVFDPSDGSIDIAAGAPAGTYSFDYQICEVANPTNCEIATATVTVAVPSLDITKIANNDTNVAPGTVVTYTYTVENDGNVDVADAVSYTHLTLPTIYSV